MSENKGFMGVDEIPASQSETTSKDNGIGKNDNDDKGQVISPVSSGVGEVSDVNDTNVNVTDPSPVIIFFGAKGSGKTMTLVRLTRYLETQGYRIVPDPLFRPATDTDYKDMCRNFIKNCRSKYAAESTSNMRFMLVKVLDKIGRPICQLLEAPGEHYFEPLDPTRQFNTYINHILELSNRRTWIFIVEYDWQGNDDTDVRIHYVDRITKMPPRVKRDHVIFTCHKVDRPMITNNLTLSNGMPNTPQIFRDIKSQYPGMFEYFRNTNPITSLFRPYNFQFVPFSAGTFTETEGGKQVYIQGDDYYPRKLWQTILKTVKG